MYKTIYHRGIPFEEAKADILKRAETQSELAVFKDFFFCTIHTRYYPLIDGLKAV